MDVYTELMTMMNEHLNDESKGMGSNLTLHSPRRVR